MTSFFKSTAGGMLICALVVLAWFSPWWVGGRNLAPLDLNSEMMRPWRVEGAPVHVKNHIVSDGADQTIVYRIIAAHDFKSEDWVGWSSLTYGGTAQYANTMALQYDWTVQLHRFFDFWTAWHLGLMAQVWIAACGMLLFLRGRSITSLWACCGALAYAANSQFVTWIYHRWALGSFCWVPWVLWAIDGYRSGKRWFWPLVPAFTCMAFLGGSLQHGLLVVIAVVAAWMDEAWSLRRANGAVKSAAASNAPTQSNLYNNAGFSRFLKLSGRYAAWGFLGVGLAGMMFAPCIDAFLKTNKLHLHTGLYGNAGNGIYPHGWLQPLFNLAAYPFQIFPSLLGRCDSLDVLKIFHSDLFFVAYFGSLPVAVAFWALWRKQSPILARLLIAFGILLPLTPLVRYLYQRLFILFILGGILAFVHFMETSTRETRLKFFRIIALTVGAGTLLWTALSLVLFAKPSLLAKLREHMASQGSGSSFGYYRDWIAGRADNLIHDLLIWSPHQLLPLLLLGITLWGLHRTTSLQDKTRSSGAWILTLAVVAEVSLFGSRWIVWVDPAKSPLFPETPETQAVRKIVGREGRVTTVIHPTGHMACTPFIPNTLCPYGIATISGYDSIVPDGMILPNETPADANRLGRLAVTHLITWPGNPDVPPEWKLAWSSPSMDLYDNPLGMPRYFGFSSNGDKTSFFKGSQPDGVTLRETTGKENTRTIEVPSGTAWIRVAENYDDGWEYRTNAGPKWMPVLRASDKSMLMEIPTSTTASSQTVEMRYAPPMRKLGFMISAASLAGLLVGWGVVCRSAPSKSILPAV